MANPAIVSYPTRGQAPEIFALRLKNIADAHGGMDYWRSLKNIDVEMSVSGFLFVMKRVPRLTRVRLTISTERPEVTIYDYPVAGKTTRFCGEGLVEILDAQGNVLQARKNPREQFSRVRRLFYWDALDFAYFSGYALWNYLTMPFLFLNPDVEVEKLDRAGHGGLTKLTVRFPKSFPTHCESQDFYFDHQWHLCRHDYTVEVLGSWAKAAHFCDEYQQFFGLSLPVKRRAFPKLFGNIPFRAITMVVIDIHDIKLEGAL